ncbi:MAG: DUF4097 family beta strand repeat-containing protein [Bacillota bacterium]
MKHKYLVATALVLILIGVAGMAYHKFKFEDEYPEHKQTWALNPDEIKKLHITSNYDVDISFSSSTGGEGYVEFLGNMHPKVIDQLKELTAVGPEFSIDLTPPSTTQFLSVNLKSPKGKINVALPKETELEDLAISTMSADIKLEGATSNNIDISSLSGSIYLTNLKANELKLDTHSGDINGDDIRSYVQASSLSGEIDLKQIEGTANLETYSGDVEISQRGVSSITATTLSGDVEITPDPDFNGFYETKTLSGSVNIPESPKESKHTIKADTHSGDIDIKLP